MWQALAIPEEALGGGCGSEVLCLLSVFKAVGSILSNANGEKKKMRGRVLTSGAHCPSGDGFWHVSHTLFLSSSFPCCGSLQAGCKESEPLARQPLITVALRMQRDKPKNRRQGAREERGAAAVFLEPGPPVL